jgi:UDP-N-acetylglucosamine:LPS N-acetylglucosamine transferase
MDELYAVSDLLVTKPGGLTVAEALQACLPVFVTHFLPGQEELNIRYLNKHALVVPLFESSFHDWPTAIMQELTTGAQRRLLEQNESRIAVVAPASLKTFPGFLLELFHKTNL